MKTIYYKSPLGPLELRLEDKILNFVGLCKGKKATPVRELTQFEKALFDSFNNYFSNNIKKIETSFQLTGTVFQKKVWQHLCKIPPGTTQSYSQVARAIGRPKAYRAVGQACNKNSLLIVVPCHRVISESGELGGFALGMKAKKYLLDLENNFLESVSN
ncbi:MAG: methylated-DNA--[protein]-cysteine S-methyltransferase [Bdellovibrionaceae bacterium]|nr:methylated-DNA--[protein]-cysteine S-methyltransferase [Pseudobdellovibrionaceae bacterium]